MQLHQTDLRTAACTGHERPLGIVGFLEISSTIKQANSEMRNKVSQENDGKQHGSYEREELPENIKNLPQYTQREQQK